MEKPNNNPSCPSYSWVYWIAAIVALAVLGIGIYRAMAFREWPMLAAGCLSVVAVLVTWPLAAQVRGDGQRSLEQACSALTAVSERFEQFSVMLNLISEQQLLSDRAKAVAFREKDRQALRHAIQEELNKGDWEAANSLANDMEHLFGYKQEADRLRRQIEEKRTEATRKQIGDSLTVIDRHIRAEQWQPALREAERVSQLFADNPQAKSLPDEVENRRQAHKRQLIESLHEAQARHDVDGGIEIVKRLDAYLTPTEAEGLQDIVRGLFKEKLNNLRTQFSVAVVDANWNEAVRIGELIIADFPNSQMAKEVREKMDTLRANAAGLGQPAAV